MRIRATVAAVSGALALTALAVPAAQADDAPKTAGLSAFAGQAKSDAVDGDTKITKAVVNGGKNLTLGTTAKKTITAEVTATDPEGIYEIHAALWNGAGSDFENAKGFIGANSQTGTCTEVNSTTTKCKYTFVVDPALMYNNTAGTWKLWTVGIGADGDSVTKTAATTFKILRAGKLTADASPEPVRKGKTVTVKGKLSRANWDEIRYAGYSGQKVQLQFRKKTSNTYTTVKTVTTNSTGNLSATTTATVDGYFRYSFAGSSTTSAVTAAGDYLDVR
ncbi:calcium-binding protein [Streptomyces flavidovirens]|uniref:calcium-binding protein n=1 Tax=Streptomyces flavidovirens TaxID=67298 RepID=UPI0034353163